MTPNKKQLKSKSKHQAPLSTKIENEYNKLVALLVQVPNKYRSTKKIEGTDGMVSVADIVAYQIGWGKLVIT